MNAPPGLLVEGQIESPPVNLGRNSRGEIGRTRTRKALARPGDRCRRGCDAGGRAGLRRPACDEDRVAVSLGRRGTPLVDDFVEAAADEGVDPSLFSDPALLRFSTRSELHFAQTSRNGA